MNNTTDVSGVMLFQTAFKVVLSTLPCFLFLYINGIMLFALLSKPLLLESSRYILFGHLLLTESLQLMFSLVLYLFAVTLVKIISYACIVVTLLAAIAVKISPLNLAVMSLERYVAICFPLRHADLATTRTMQMAIAVMWTMASLDSFIQLFLFFSLENTTFTLPRFCMRNTVLRLQIYSTMNKTFTILYFVLVSMIIIYTYIAIIITVKTSSSKASKSNKAHKTVLLHLVQLCLCLMSTLFNMINTSNVSNLNSAVAHQIQFGNIGKKWKWKEERKYETTSERYNNGIHRVYVMFNGKVYQSKRRGCGKINGKLYNVQILIWL
ncbi:Olfactory receptor 2T6 [Nibea albiflora]|uniref:Olfactory receptor 2T6 n=1 Tax=Nibea albiflora TaxID=240163 RepID=A0ACB7F5K6_NIBAL|nr:Olfactory receptor 2T6 [Nibea albiflora]